MRIRSLAYGIVVLCTALGCAQAPAAEGEQPPELTPELKALVLSEAPTDIAHPLYADFNGKAELLGYALEPAGTAAPGSKLQLKLFWRSTGKLDDGYLPFTELVTPDGRRLPIEAAGPVRSGALVPKNWQPGKVYIDELDVSIPSDIDVARLSLVVGLKTAPIESEKPEGAEKPSKAAEKPAEKASQGTFGNVYLSVLSGPSDPHGAVLTTLETGVTSAGLRAQQAKVDKRGIVKRAPSKVLGAAKPRAVEPAP